MQVEKINHICAAWGDIWLKLGLGHKRRNIEKIVSWSSWLGSLGIICEAVLGGQLWSYQLGSIRCQHNIRWRYPFHKKDRLFQPREIFFFMLEAQQATCETSAATYKLMQPPCSVFINSCSSLCIQSPPYTMLRLPESAGGSSPPGSKYEGFVIDLIQVEPSKADSSYLSSFEMD